MSDSADESLRTYPLGLPATEVSGRAREMEVSSALAPASPRVKSPGGLVWKATVAFAVTILALETVLLVTGHYYWREILENQVHAHLSAVAASRAEMVELGIKLIRQQAALGTERAEFRRFLVEWPAGEPAEVDRVNSQKRVEKIADGDSVFLARLADSAGKIIFSSDPTEVGRDVSGDPEFRNGLVDSYLGTPRQVNNHLEATVAAPILSRKVAVGVLLMNVSIAPLADPLIGLTGLGENGEAMLVVRESQRIRYLLPPRKRPELTQVSVADAPALAATIANGGTFLRQIDYRGEPVLAAGSSTPYQGWTVVAKMDEAEAYAPFDRARRVRMLYGLLLAAAGTVAAYLLARRMTRPVQRLSVAAARVARGDYSEQVPVTSSDELGALSASFNEMVAAIRLRGLEREEAEAALRHADRRKNDFLAILGHELRNPVAAIAAGVLVWKDSEDDPTTAAFVREVIERQTANLKRLVDDLLDVARITTGKVELRKRAGQVSEMIRHAVHTARPLIEEKHHQLQVSLAADRTLWIEADSTRIEQVLTNLLTNAAKYTHDGGHITVAERQDGDQVVITVSDDGIGIAPELFGKIFDLFTQGNASLDRPAGGLGIGLSLSRQLVELHGGTIIARSAGTGCGAEFTVRLPVIPPPTVSGEAAPLVPAAAVETPWRILLVDDNHDSTRLLSQLLERRGHHVCVAYDGVAGLAAAHRFNPDVLILDIGLPEIDGYELARRLRAEGFVNSLLIALSGYAQESDLARAREAGFDHHFAKPVDFDALAQLIATGVQP